MEQDIEFVPTGFAKVMDSNHAAMKELGIPEKVYLKLTNVTMRYIIEDTKVEVKESIKFGEYNDGSFKPKKFNSCYSENDRTLPYDFDLHFDIKTEGELAYALTHGTGHNPLVNIEEMAYGYGYDVNYLVKLYPTKLG